MSAIVLDCETTGLGEFDRIVELCVVYFDDSFPPWVRRFDPGEHVPAEATEIHGISTQDLAGCDTFAAHAGTIKAMIESAEAVVGYNPSFDRGMIDGEVRRLPGERPIVWPILVDAKRLWDVYEPREKRDLTNAYRRFVSRDGFQGAHGALADSRATAAVLRAQMLEFGLVGTPWGEMDPERKLWWGPTSHVLSVDGHLVVNFGKSRGVRVVDVDVGYFRWVAERDFPRHVLMLALRVIRMSESPGYPRDLMSQELTFWAEKFEMEGK